MKSHGDSQLNASEAPQASAAETIIRSPVWPEYAPTIWSGMTLGAWWKVLRAERFDVDPRWFGRAGVLFATGAINSVLSVADRLLINFEPEVSGRLGEAVFVIGHWRTGTTFLHELLAAHHDLVAPTTYQVFAPAHFRVSEKWLAPILAKLLPPMRPQDAVELSLDAPQEDEFAINALGARGPSRAFGFPRTYLEDQTVPIFVAGTPEEDWRAPWLTFARRFAAGASDRRPVFKSPAHTARIAEILQMLPRARFIHLVREPHAIHASSVAMMEALMRQHGFQAGGHDRAAISQLVIRNMIELYRGFAAAEASLQSDRHVVVRFEDLVREPVAQVEHCLATLEIERPDKASRAKMSATSLRFARHERPKRHIAPHPDEGAEIEEAWKFYFDRFDYPVAFR